MKLFDRPLSASLQAALKDAPVACLLGPRQSGKSTLARTLEPAYAYVSLDDEAALAFARSDPTGFVASLPDPVVLDEVQRCRNCCARSSWRWIATANRAAMS